MHELRHRVLSRGLPTRQPHPGMERSGRARAVRRGERPPARDEQLPRAHRKAMPGAVRGLVRARDHCRAGADQAGRARDRRVGGQLWSARAPPGRHEDRKEGGDRRFGPCRARGGPAAHPGGARSGGLRACRAHRWPAALRNPRVQAGEVGAGPAPGPDGRRGDGVPCARRGRKAGSVARRGGPRCCSDGRVGALSQGPSRRIRRRRAGGRCHAPA